MQMQIYLQRLPESDIYQQISKNPVISFADIKKYYTFAPPKRRINTDWR